MSNYSKNIWFDGEIIPFNDAKIHVMSHCVHYGSGVFEGIKCYDTPNGPAVFRLKEHMDRLHASANAFNIKIPFTADELCQATISLIKSNEVKNCYLRPVAFYGFDTLGVHPKNCPVQVSIATLDWGAYVSKEALEKGAKITISPWRKFETSSFPASTKASGQYLNSLLAVQDAKTRGFDEALLLNIDDTIAEGSGQNIFIIKDGMFHTNDYKSNILMGITRDSIFTILKNMNLDYKIDTITKEDLFDADEVFYCGSASEITPIRQIDNHIVGDGKMGHLTSQLQKMYYNIVRGNEEEYFNWLSFVNS